MVYRPVAHLPKVLIFAKCCCPGPRMVSTTMALRLDSPLAIWLACHSSLRSRSRSAHDTQSFQPGTVGAYFTLAFATSPLYLINESVAIHHWLPWSPCGFMFRGVTKAGYHVSLLLPCTYFSCFWKALEWTWSVFVSTCHFGFLVWRGGLFIPSLLTVAVKDASWPSSSCSLPPVSEAHPHSSSLCAHVNAPQWNQSR